MPQVRPNTAKKKKSQGQPKGPGVVAGGSTERGGGSDSWGRRCCSPLGMPTQVRARSVLFGHLPRQAQSAPASWGEGVFKPVAHLAGLRAAAVGPETHTHTHPRNMGYVCMHMCREHAKCNRTDSCTHEHCTDRHTPLQTCRPSMYTHTPGVT